MSGCVYFFRHSCQLFLELALGPTALHGLRDFPIEAPANPLKQFPIVQPQHRLTRFAINRHPAPLCARVRRYFYFSHLIPPCTRFTLFPILEHYPRPLPQFDYSLRPQRDSGIIRSTHNLKITGRGDQVIMVGFDLDDSELLIRLPIRTNSEHRVKAIFFGFAPPGERAAPNSAPPSPTKTVKDTTSSCKQSRLAARSCFVLRKTTPSRTMTPLALSRPCAKRMIAVAEAAIGDLQRNAIGPLSTAPRF